MNIHNWQILMYNSSPGAMRLIEKMKCMHPTRLERFLELGGVIDDF